MSRYDYYYLPRKYISPRTLPFAIAIAYVIDGREGYFLKGDVMLDMNLLLQRGFPFAGDHTETGRWDNRDAAREETVPLGATDDMYFAWTDRAYWGYDPHLVVFSPAEYTHLFIECCRTFVTSRPERYEEFAMALDARGLTF